MFISLHIVSGCFCSLMAQLSSCDRNHIIHEAPDIYHLTFYWKGFLIPALDNKLQETGAQSHFLSPEFAHCQAHNACTWRVSLNIPLIILSHGRKRWRLRIDTLESPRLLPTQRWYLWWLTAGILELDTPGLNLSSSTYKLYDIDNFNLSKAYLHNMRGK